MIDADLASARRRVIERRAQRLQNHNNGRHRNNADSTGAVSRFGYIQSSVTNAWSILRSYEGTRPAVRVRQVDTELLDQELLGLFQGQVREALKYYQVG